MSYEPPSYPPASGPEPGAAAARLTVPAVLLIVVGVLNLLGAIGLIAVGFGFTTISVEDFDKQMKQDRAQAERIDVLRKQGWSTQDLLNVYIYGPLGGGAVHLLASLLTTAGGISMLLHKARALALLGGITAAIPLISCLGCCGVGQVVGIWALVVLLNPDVKAAFASSPGDTPPGQSWGDDNLP